MKAKVSAIVFLAAYCLCLPVVATVATAGDAQLGVPPEHEMWQRPVELCRGITLRAYALDEPQLMKAFVARISLDEPGIGFTATDRDEKWGEPMPDYTNRTVLIHTKRETTPNFMLQRRAAGEPVVLAVNATPWGPWDCAAAFRSTYASLRGWNVSHGVELSQSKRPRRGALFVVYKDGKADIGYYHVRRGKSRKGRCIRIRRVRPHHDEWRAHGLRAPSDESGACATYSVRTRRKSKDARAARCGWPQAELQHRRLRDGSL